MMTQTTETETETARAVVPQRLVLALGGALTLLSMAWTAWSVVDLAAHAAPTMPTAVAVAVAAGVELAWLAIVAVEWQQVHRAGRVPRGLAWTGWGTAAAVVAVLALHAWLVSPALLVLAALPLAGKTLWHWALASLGEEVRAQQAEARRQEEEEARRAAEEQRRAAELDTGLTPEQQAELAELRRQAAYLRERAAAEAEVTQARAEAERLREEIDHQLRRETLRRAAELRMDTDRTTAEVLLQRVELERELRLSQPVLGLTAGTPAPAAEPGQEQAEPGKRRPDSDLDDPTVVDAAWRDIARRLDGEGGVAVGGGTPDTPPATPAELDENRSEVPARGGTPGSGPVTGADLGEEPATVSGGGDTRERVWQAIRRYGPAVSTRALAEELELSRTTVKNHRDALARRGYPVYDR